MAIEECNARQMIAEEKATSWRLRECIQVREFAATHRLGRMRRLWMLEDPFNTKLYQSEVAPHSSRVHARNERRGRGIDTGNCHFAVPRPRNVIQRRDGCPRSIRGQMNPEYRALRLNQRRGKECFVFKPVSMGFSRQSHKPRPGGYHYFASSRRRGRRQLLLLLT